MPRLLLKFIRKADRLLENIRRRLSRWLGLFRDKPVISFTYRGFGRQDKVWLRGRILRDRGIITTIQDSKWRTLVNNYKRFGSKEISNARLKVSIGSNEFELHTDPEGYFKLYHGLEHPLPEITGSWRKAGIHVIEIPERKVNRHFSSELLIPPREAQFGIISDIDDTVLKTDVTSLLKLKLIYHTLFKNAATRKAFLEATAFYRSLEYGTLSHPVNPVFYVSNSPWNLYDLLDEFLELNHLPKGPILLRDFGLPYEEVEKGYVGHKHSSILQILETFPTLPFILIGDSGEKDPYIYQAVAESHPDRIAAIYIRDVRSSRRRRKLQRYIDDTKADITVVENYAQAAKHAATRQLLSPLKFEQYRSPRST